MEIFTREIIEVGKRLQQLNLISATEGNISIRHQEDQIFATRTGTRKGDLITEDIIKFNLKSPAEGELKKASSEIKLHLEYYLQREDISAVIHAHPVNCIALMMADIQLNRAYLPEMVVLLGAVPTAKYATPSTVEVPLSIRQFVSETDVILLDRHGAVVAAESLKLALIKLETLEHGAESILKAAILKGKLPPALPEYEVKRLIDLRTNRYKIHGRFSDKFVF